MEGRQGFTIIEVVMVMAIIAITIGLAGPRIGAGLSTLELHQSEQTVKSYIQFAKIRARRSDEGCYLILDNTKRSIGLLGPDMRFVREQTLPSSVSFILKPPFEKVAISVAPSGIFSGDAVRLQGRNGAVEVSLR